MLISVCCDKHPEHVRQVEEEEWKKVDKSRRTKSKKRKTVFVSYRPPNIGFGLVNVSITVRINRLACGCAIDNLRRVSHA